MSEGQGRAYQPDQRVPDNQERRSLEEICADQMVHEAENARARIYDVPGKHQVNDHILHNNFTHSAMVDETYLAVASHVEEAVVKKIVNCKFV